MNATKSRTTMPQFEQHKLAKLHRLVHDPHAKIAVDVEGTLALIHPPLVEIYNERHRTNFTINDITNYDTSKSRIGMPWDEFLDIYNTLWEDRQHRIEPSVSIAEIEALKHNFSADLVTYKPAEQGKALEEWLAAKFPGVSFNDGTKMRIVPTQEKKVHLPYNIYIDDAPPVADEVIEHLVNGERKTKFLLVISQPWNRRQHYENNEDVLVVKDLRAAIALLLELKSMPQHDTITLSETVAQGIVLASDNL